MMGLRQIFESENISFVEVSEELIQDYLGMVNDIEHVDRFIGGWHEPYTEADEVRWVREQLAVQAPVFSMIEKKSGKFIGNIELMDVTETAGEIGIAITAKMQGKGYGRVDLSANPMTEQSMFTRNAASEKPAARIPRSVWNSAGNGGTLRENFSGTDSIRRT